LLENICMNVNKISELHYIWGNFSRFLFWQRRSAADNHWRTMNIHQSDGTLLLVACCKLQQYANEGSETCASLAARILSVIAVVMDTKTCLRAWAPAGMGKGGHMPPLENCVKHYFLRHS